MDEAYQEERLDPALGKLVPQGVDVVKTAALPASLTRSFGLGDISLRAFVHLREGVRRVIRTRGPDVVFITGSPYYPMLFARMIKREFGRPVVLDFQDPWVSDWGATRSRLSKAGLSHSLAKVLEPLALRDADYITSVSQRQNEDMARRYPWLPASHMAAIPIGGDPADYLAREEVAAGAVKLEPDKINIVYVGTLLPRAEAVVKQLFEAVAQARLTAPALVQRMRFTFVGTSNQPNGHGVQRVTPLAAAQRVEDLVTEIPQRVPYLEALDLLARADLILLIGSDEPHYTASKIYPALLSGTPTLGLYHSASSAFQILVRAASGHVVGFESVDELQGKRHEIVAALLRAASPGRGRDPRNESFLDQYGARNIAHQFGEIFRAVSDRFEAPRRTRALAQ